MNARVVPGRATAGLLALLATAPVLAQVSLPSPPTAFPADASSTPMAVLDTEALQQAQQEAAEAYADSQRPSVTLKVPLQVSGFDAAAFPPEAGIRSDQDAVLSCRLTLQHPGDPQRFHFFEHTRGLPGALENLDAGGMYTVRWYLDDASTRDFVAQGMVPKEYACKLAPSVHPEYVGDHIWSADVTLCDWNVQGEGTRCLVRGQLTDPR